MPIDPEEINNTQTGSEISKGGSGFQISQETQNVIAKAQEAEKAQLKATPVEKQIQGAAAAIKGMPGADQLIEQVKQDVQGKAEPKPPVINDEFVKKVYDWAANSSNVNVTLDYDQFKQKWFSDPNETDRLYGKIESISQSEKIPFDISTPESFRKSAGYQEEPVFDFSKLPADYKEKLREGINDLHGAVNSNAEGLWNYISNLDQNLTGMAEEGWKAVAEAIPGKKDELDFDQLDSKKVLAAPNLQVSDSYSFLSDDKARQEHVRESRSDVIKRMQSDFNKNNIFDPIRNNAPWYNQEDLGVELNDLNSKIDSLDAIINDPENNTVTYSLKEVQSDPDYFERQDRIMKAAEKFYGRKLTKNESLHPDKFLEKYHLDVRKAQIEEQMLGNDSPETKRMKEVTSNKQLMDDVDLWWSPGDLHGDQWLVKKAEWIKNGTYSEEDLTIAERVVSEDRNDKEQLKKVMNDPARVLTYGGTLAYIDKLNKRIQNRMRIRYESMSKSIEAETLQKIDENQKRIRATAEEDLNNANLSISDKYGKQLKKLFSENDAYKAMFAEYQQKAKSAGSQQEIDAIAAEFDQQARAIPEIKEIYDAMGKESKARQGAVIKRYQDELSKVQNDIVDANIKKYQQETDKWLSTQYDPKILSKDGLEKRKQEILSKYGNIIRNGSQDSKTKILRDEWNRYRAEKGLKLGSYTAKEAEREFYFTFKNDLFQSIYTGAPSTYAIKNWAQDMKERLSDEEWQRKITRQMQVEGVPVSSEMLNVGQMITNLDKIIDHPEKDEGFFKDLYNGFTSKEFAEYVPVVASIYHAARDYNVKSLSDKLESGTPLTYHEEMVLKSTAAMNNMNKLRPTSTGYNVGSGIADMVPYLGEFALTKGAFSVSKEATKSALTNAFKRGVETSIKEGRLAATSKLSGMFRGAGAEMVAKKEAEQLLESRISKYAIGGLSYGVGAIAMTAANPQQVVRNTVERMVPQMSLTFSTDGDGMVQTIDEKGEDFWTALAKGTGMTWAELFTEQLGGHMMKAGKDAMNWVATDREWFKRSVLGGWMAKRGITNEKTAMELIAKQKIGWDGILDEYLEEFANGRISNYITGDRDVWDIDPKEELQTFLTVAVAGAPIKVTKAAHKGYTKLADRNKTHSIEFTYADNEGGFNETSVTISNADYNGLKTMAALPRVYHDRFLNDIMQRNDLTPIQKEVMSQYFNQLKITKAKADYKRRVASDQHIPNPMTVEEKQGEEDQYKSRGKLAYDVWLESSKWSDENPLSYVPADYVNISGMVERGEDLSGIAPYDMHMAEKWALGARDRVAMNKNLPKEEKDQSIQELNNVIASLRTAADKQLYGIEDSIADNMAMVEEETKDLNESADELNSDPVLFENEPAESEEESVVGTSALSSDKTPVDAIESPESGVVSNEQALIDEQKSIEESNQNKSVDPASTEVVEVKPGVEVSFPDGGKGIIKKVKTDNAVIVEKDGKTSTYTKRKNGVWVKKGNRDNTYERQGMTIGTTFIGINDQKPAAPKKGSLAKPKLNTNAADVVKDANEVSIPFTPETLFEEALYLYDKSLTHPNMAQRGKFKKRFAAAMEQYIQTKTGQAPTKGKKMDVFAEITTEREKRITNNIPIGEHRATKPASTEPVKEEVKPVTEEKKPVTGTKEMTKAAAESKMVGKEEKKPTKKKPTEKKEKKSTLLDDLFYQDVKAIADKASLDKHDTDGVNKLLEIIEAAEKGQDAKKPHTTRGTDKSVSQSFDQILNDVAKEKDSLEKNKLRRKLQNMYASAKKKGGLGKNVEVDAAAEKAAKMEEGKKKKIQEKQKEISAQQKALTDKINQRVNDLQEEAKKSKSPEVKKAISKLNEVRKKFPDVEKLGPATMIDGELFNVWIKKQLDQGNITEVDYNNLREEHTRMNAELERFKDINQRQKNTEDDVLLFNRARGSKSSETPSTGRIGVARNRQTQNLENEKLETIIARVAKKFGKYVKIRKNNKKKLGFYSTNQDFIGLLNRGINNLEVFAHEVGHMIDFNFGIFDAIDKLDTNDPLWNQVDEELDTLHEYSGQNEKEYDMQRREGLAEFMRSYVADPQATSLRFPGVTSFYDNLVSEDFKQAITEYSDVVREFYSQPASEITKANITDLDIRVKRKGIPFNVHEATTVWTWFETKFLNELTPFTKELDKLRELKKESGMAILPKDDFRVPLRLLLGHGAKSASMMKYGLTDIYGNRLKAKNGNVMNMEYLLDPLSATSEDKLKQHMMDVSAYMVAQRTIELSEKLYNKEQAELDNEWNTLIKENENVKRIMAQRKQSGLTGIGGGYATDIEIAQATLDEYEKMKTTNPEYYNGIVESANRYREFTQAILKYYLDSGMMSEETYNDVINNNQHYVMLNRVIDDIPQDFGNLFQSDRLVRKAGSKRSLRVERKGKQVKGSSRTVINPYISLIEHMNGVMRNADKNRFLNDIVDTLDELNKAVPGQANFFATKHTSEMGSPSKEGMYIDIYKNGKQERWEIPTENRDMYKAIRALNGLEAHIPIISDITRFFKSVITKTPWFAARNFIRDTFDRVQKTRAGSALNFGNYEEMRRQLATAGGDQSMYNSHPENYYQFMGSVMKDLVKKENTWFVNTARKFSPKKGLGFQSLFHGLDNLYTHAELSNRIAEYSASYKKYSGDFLKEYMDAKNAGLINLSDEEIKSQVHNDAMMRAAYEARDLLDFAVFGTWSRYLNEIIPFFNPGVQGVARFWRGTTESPEAAMRNMMKVVFISGAMEIITRAMQDASGDGDDFVQRPDYEKDMFWMFKVGDNWIRVPKPFEQGVFSSIIGRAYDRYVRGDENAFTTEPGLFGTDSWWLTSFIPKTTFFADAELWSKAGRLGNNPIADLLRNYDSFRDRPIVPVDEEKMKLSKRNKEYTKKNGFIAKALDNAGLADARQVDFFINSLGDWGRAGNELINWISGDPDAKVPGLSTAVKGFVTDANMLNTRDYVAVGRIMDENGVSKHARERKVMKRLAKDFYEADTDAEKKRAAKKATEFSKGYRKILEDRVDKYDEVEYKKLPSSAVESEATKVRKLVEKVGL